MQRHRLIHPALERIHLRKPPHPRIVIAGAQVVLIQSGIVLLAGEPIAVLGRAGLVEDIAEGRVIIAVGDRAEAVCQRARGAESVVLIIADLAVPVLAEQVMAVAVGDGISTVAFHQHLGVIPVVIDQVVRRRAYIWGQSKNSSFAFGFGPLFSGLTRRPARRSISSLNRSLPSAIP